MKTQSISLIALSLLLAACQSPGPGGALPDRSALILQLSRADKEKALTALHDSLRSGPWSAKDRSDAFHKILRDLKQPRALALTLELCSDPALMLQSKFRKDFSNWLSKRLKPSDIEQFAKRYDSALVVFVTQYREDPKQHLLQRLQSRQRSETTKDPFQRRQLSLQLRLDLELILNLKESELRTLAPELRIIIETALSQSKDEPLRAFLIRSYGRLGSLLPPPQRSSWRTRVLRALDEETGFSRQEAILAAGKLGGPALLERLEETHDAWLQPGLRLQTARALAYQSAEPVVQGLLLSRLSDWNEDVRKVAFKALLSEPQYKERRSLALRAFDENEDIALAGVAVISSGTSPNEALAVMQRFERLPPKDEIQRSRIFALLAKKGPVEFLSTGLSWNVGSFESYEAVYQRAIAEKKVFEVLRRCLARGNNRARLFALSKLFRRPPKETGFEVGESVKVALYTLQSDPDKENVLSAIIFLQRHGGAIEVRDALYEIIEDHRLPSVRLEALRTLSLFPSREKQDALELASKDLSPINRAFCYQELARSAHRLGLVLMFRNLKAYKDDQQALGDAVYLLMETLAANEKAKPRLDLYRAQLQIWGRSPKPEIALFALKGLAALSKSKTLPRFEASKLKELREQLIPR